MSQKAKRNKSKFGPKYFFKIETSYFNILNAAKS